MDTPILETERLLLRAINDEDLEQFAEMIFRNPEVMLTLPQDPKTDEEVLSCAREYMDTYSRPWPDEDQGGWAVCARTDDIARPGSLLGFCGFEQGHIQDYELELGFGYGQSCWGKGVGLEAAKACRDWFLTQHRWNQFYACHFRHNTGSQRIIQRIGMTCVSDMELHGSVAKGIGLFPVYTFDKRAS